MNICINIYMSIRLYTYVYTDSYKTHVYIYKYICNMFIDTDRYVHVSINVYIDSYTDIKHPPPEAEHLRNTFGEALV